jgi:phage-related protein
MTLGKNVRPRLAAVAALVAAGLVAGGLWAAAPMAVNAHLAALQVQTSLDGPSGFWYGTDSSYMAIPGSAPYREPVIGSAYGGYIGMIGNWAHWQGCNGKVVWSKTDARDARTNFVTYHKGIGTGAYWFMAGPGVDPHYNGTTAEAATWGRQQAARALSDLAQRSPRVTYPVVFMDVEIPGDAPSYTPAPDNGWNTVYTSPCSGKVRTYHIAASVDRADFNGFAGYLTTHSKYKAGVYSAPPIWTSIFGTGTAASITNTYEWTYLAATRSLTNPPYRWCLPGTTTCARFFGGITRASKYALMWQWSGGGGYYNGYGDFDQIDGNRTP